MNQFILEKTRCYLIGPIESALDCGVGWRQYCKSHLEWLDIIVFDPTDKPFVKDLSETNEMQISVKTLRENKQYEELSTIMREIRSYDLGLVDKSDFIIFNFNPNNLTCGSWEEFFLANREKKPIFFVCEAGMEHVPLWVYGTISEKYIYTDMDDCLDMITDIHTGAVEIDSNRWRLLAKNYR